MKFHKYYYLKTYLPPFGRINQRGGGLFQKDHFSDMFLQVFNVRKKKKIFIF